MTMTPFERWSVWLTTAGTLVTGVAYWWMKDLLVSTDPWAVINHPLQPWMLKAHILIAPFLVFSVGLITSRHIWRHYRSPVRRGRRTGIVAGLTFGLMVVSGYVLQVVTAEALLRALGWAHLGLGIVYSVGVAAHWPATRSRRSTGAHSAARTGAEGEAMAGGPGFPKPARSDGGRGRRRRRVDHRVERPADRPTG